MTQRVIKFRCWEPTTNTMHYNLGYISNGGSAIMGEHRPIIGGTLLQYVGLTDKHGNEIYEGDIVRILYSDWPSKADSDPRTLDEYMRDIALIRIVIWSFNGFYVSISVDGYAESIEPGRHGYIEKIGDIYTTPELVDPKMIER